MASSQTGTFSPNDVTVLLTNSTGMSHTVSGFQEDSIVTVTPNKPRFAHYTSADNVSARVYSGDTSVMVTLHLNQTSASNDILDALHKVDVNGFDGFFELTISDNSGRTKFYSPEAYIGTVPEAMFGTSLQPREWVIYAGRASSTIGGNSKLSAEDLKTMVDLGFTVNERWQN